MTKEEARKLVLESKKMKLEFIPERKNAIYTSIHPDHIASSLMEGCKKTWELPLSGSDGGYKRILTSEEQRAFEILLDKKEGDLGFFKIGQPENFWNDPRFAVVTIKSKEGYLFDLANPLDNIRYRVLCACEDVSESWDDRLSDLSYKWAFKEEGYTSRVNADFTKLKSKAYVELSKISSIDKKRNILISLGLRIADNVSEEFMLNKFEEIINTKESTAKLPSVKDLIEAIENKDTDETAFINECITKKIFKYKAVGKYLYDDEVLIKTGGKSALIEYLKDPENEEFKETIKHRLSSLKND